MSFLTQISLTQFRNYAQRSFHFPERITSITGPNGSGKTALLDAVYYLCYTKSYFSAQQQHSVQRGTDGFRVEGCFRNERGSDHQITCVWREGRKEVLADGVAYDKIAAHIGRFAAVMIAPDDMGLIHEGSEVRRRWMDGILSQTDAGYLERLLLYQRVLQQRNAWLRMQATAPSSTRTELEFYDAQLSDAGGYLHKRRSQFLETFLPILNRLYRQLSKGAEAASIIYESELREANMQSLLRACFEHDLRLQRSTKGIHRDDLSFRLNEMPLRQYASQGQKKSFVFALKLAQYAYLATALGSLPILLLDDLFEKLDQGRMEALLEIIEASDFGQVLLTDTHAGRVKSAFGADVHTGEIRL